MAKPIQAMSEAQSGFCRQRQWPPPTPSPCFQLCSPWCFLTLCPTKGLPVLEIFLCCLSVCRSHTAANITGRSLGIFLKQCSCQGPTTVGLWQLLSPGRSRLAAGWRWPRSALLCFHIKGGIETTTSDAWQEKKELNAEFYPPLILLSKFVEESCSFSQGKSASLTDWHCLCWNRLLRKQISLQKNVSASTRNNRKSKWA